MAVQRPRAEVKVQGQRVAGLGQARGQPKQVALAKQHGVITVDRGRRARHAPRRRRVPARSREAAANGPNPAF